MSQNKVSVLMLERYRLGELNPEDQKTVNEALASDENLRSGLETLDESDRELRLRYPVEYFNFEQSGFEKTGSERGIPENLSVGMRMRRFTVMKNRRNQARFAGIAVIFMACILLPVM